MNKRHSPLIDQLNPEEIKHYLQQQGYRCKASKQRSVPEVLFCASKKEKSLLVACLDSTLVRDEMVVVEKLQQVVAEKKNTAGLVVKAGEFNRETVAYADRHQLQLLDGHGLQRALAEKPMVNHRRRLPKGWLLSAVCLLAVLLTAAFLVTSSLNSGLSMQRTIVTTVDAPLRHLKTLWAGLSARVSTTAISTQEEKAEQPPAARPGTLWLHDGGSLSCDHIQAKGNTLQCQTDQGLSLVLDKDQIRQITGRVEKPVTK